MTERSEYSRVAIALHWSVAAVILAMLFTAFQSWTSTSEQAGLYWLQLHGSIGVLFSLLIGARIVYHFRTVQPPPLTKKPWERALSVTVHTAMLVLIGIQLVTGPIDVWSGGWGIDVFGWFEIPPPFAKWDEASHELIGSVHRWTGVAILCLVVLHMLGALKHHFVDDDRTFQRMLGL